MPIRKGILKTTVTKGTTKKVTFATPPVQGIMEFDLDPDTEAWRVIYINSSKTLQEKQVLHSSMVLVF